MVLGKRKHTNDENGKLQTKLARMYCKLIALARVLHHSI